jgi:hypothetical protein
MHHQQHGDAREDETLRFKLVRQDGTVKGHIVAPSGEDARHFLREHHDELGVRLTRAIVERIDEKLVRAAHQGLDDILNGFHAGYVSECPPLGWFIHPPARFRQHLWRIDAEGEEPVHIIAPDADTASAIWVQTAIDDEGTHPMWSIKRGFEDLVEDQRTAMEGFLPGAPSAIVSWNGNGWSMQ